MSTVYGLQSTIYITFDNNHLPNTIVSNSTTVATYAFNGVNAPITKKLGNTVSLNIEYNNRYAITKHDWKLNGNTIAGYNYGHDSVGNRIWSENLVNANKNELFVFDNADRLTSFKTGTLNGSKTAIITPTYTQDWSLDSIGNWAGFNDNGTNSTNVFSDTHAMTEFKGVIQTFDSNGNIIFDGVRAFKYDAFNRIIEVKISTIILAEYQYDAFNRRVVKKVDADLNGSFELITKFLYDGFRCIEELNGSDVLVQDFVYGSLYIDEVILQRTGATDYYFTHDYRYSVTNLTISAGSIIESYDYKVYGERISSGSGLTTIGYTGQRHDVETGLMYFKNRYYSTSMGSFVTRDPLEYVDGMSMYLGYFGGQGRDPKGKFNVYYHGKVTHDVLKELGYDLDQIALVVSENYKTDIYSELLNIQNVADYLKNKYSKSREDIEAYKKLIQSMHFDNLKSIDDIKKHWEMVTSKLKDNCAKCDPLLNLMMLGMILHSVQDFYAHSNFVDLAVKAGYTKDNMVTYNQWQKSETQIPLDSDLFTGQYPADHADPKGHDIMNKDSPFNLEKEPGHKLHNEAIAAATKGTKEMVKKFEEFVGAECLGKIKDVKFNNEQRNMIRNEIKSYKFLSTTANKYTGSRDLDTVAFDPKKFEIY